MRVFFLLSMTVVCCSLCASEPPGEKHIYKTVNEKELAIYVTKPDGLQTADSRPAILFFHGGGWVGGAPGQFTEHAKYFASRGLVCFQAQYRLLDKKNEDPPTICIRDARSAMRWVRSRATEFGIDPNRIASAGGSAGGHLAATLGTIDAHNEPAENVTVSTRSNAMILFNPVFDNGPGGWGTKRVGERFKEFSPAHNITAETPPTIVFLGDSDALVPVETLKSFSEKMTAAGTRCESIVFAGMPHGFFNHGRNKNVPYVKTVRAADVFLVSLGWLRGPPTLPDVEESDAEKSEAKDSKSE